VRGLGKGLGAGLYLQVAPTWVWLGGGFWAPQPDELRLVRQHLTEHTPAFRRILAAAPFRRTFGTLQGARLQRVPRGYPPDHPAADLLKHKQFYVGYERPAAFAHGPTFYRDVIRVFRTILPFVRFLNAPLLAAPREFSLATDATSRSTTRSIRR
jgi:uncharacterized protein (TIGR02453 family)